MKRPVPSIPPLRRLLICLAALLLVFLLAPFPGPQALVHTALVLGLAVDPSSSLLTGVYAAAGGWALEGSLRLYPHLGGTPWADMTVALAAMALARGWPASSYKAWLARLLGLQLLHLLLVHLAVRLAAGPVAWGTSWLWPLLALPLWGWLVWRWTRPEAR